MLNIGICDDCKEEMNLIYDLVTKTLFSEEDMRFISINPGRMLSMQ